MYVKVNSNSNNFDKNSRLVWKLSEIKISTLFVYPNIEYIIWAIKYMELESSMKSYFENVYKASDFGDFDLIPTFCHKW